jgi:hypothetical protein
MRKDRRQTGMQKLTVAFCNPANAPTVLRPSHTVYLRCLYSSPKQTPINAVYSLTGFHNQGAVFTARYALNIYIKQIMFRPLRVNIHLQKLHLKRRGLFLLAKWTWN